MDQSSSNMPANNQWDDISSLEDSIQRREADINDTRKSLRCFFLTHASADITGHSIGDALALLAQKPIQNAIPAIVLLRSLAIDGLIPQPNSANQIIRYTVEICERAIPDIIRFLKIDTNLQNYEKYALLCTCHKQITQLLTPLRLPYGDLEALLRARREILGCLNHSIVRTYAGPFNLAEVRTTIEHVFSCLKALSSEDTTFLTDVNECNRVISSAKAEISVMRSFLKQEFLYVFLQTCESVLSRFLTSLRGRFAATIEWGGGPAYELQKRYPLHEPERVIQVTVPLRNTGPGMATDVRVRVEHEGCVTYGCEILILGNVLPGDFSATLDVMVISRCSRFDGILSIEWGEIGNPTRKEELVEFHVIAQSSDVDWDSLKYRSPYSTEVAEGDQFFGREDKVQNLAAKLLRSSMESFYITGQKRVGKTSLALAAAQYAKENSGSKILEVYYTLWGGVVHADPSVSVRQLGERIERFIANFLPSDRIIPRGDYHGSLANLITISDTALQAAPNHRFLIILDEFDEIHQELFLHGNLAETFFGNLRALSRCKNICIVLVGGENMPFIMDRQGQKLNNFSRVNLSYFSRDREWNDFQLLVRMPSRGILNWHDDAVSEVFNFTNGNPYFAKIVCASTFRTAVLERDADITANEVKRATESEVSELGANSFAHLWQDGVPKATTEREPDILRRMRVLVALGRCLRKGLPPTASQIADLCRSKGPSEAETLAVLHDFVRRYVLIEDGDQYSFGLPIFRLWLLDVGVSQLIADKLNEELADVALTQENAALVHSKEVVELASHWPTYRGRHIGTDEVRAWFQQVDSKIDQRILFELLKRTRVFSESFVRERLKSVHKFLTPSLPTFVIRSRNARRKDILLTYLDGEGKSGASYASLYTEENGIAADCVIAPGDFSPRFDKHVSLNGDPAALVIMDDIAATGKSIITNVADFISKHGGILKNTLVRVVTIVATELAYKSISESSQSIEGVNIDFRSCEILPQEHYAFPPDKPVWGSKEEESRAKALCIDIGSTIYNRNPLGYGNLGLLVVFPTTVPNNSLPILHSYSRTDTRVPGSPFSRER